MKNNQTFCLNLFLSFYSLLEFRQKYQLRIQKVYNENLMEKAELEHSSASNIDFQFASIYYRMSQNGYNFKYSSLSSLHFHDASLGTAKCKTCNYNVIHKSQFGSNFDCVQIKT